MEGLFNSISSRNFDAAVNSASSAVRDNPGNAAAAKKKLTSAFADAAPVSYEIISESTRPDKNTATLKVRFAFKNKSMTMDEEYDFVQEGGSWKWNPSSASQK